MSVNGLVIGISGVWMIAAGIIGFGRVGNVWNYYVIGVIVTILALAMLDGPRINRTVSIILGLWLIVSTFIPALFTGSAARWNAYIAGIVLAVAGFSAPVRRSRETPSETRRAA